VKPATASLVAVTSRVGGAVKDEALNCGYGVHPQLEPYGTESPRATTDHAPRGIELASEGPLAQPLTSTAHANPTNT
jgi:hypothetical protein